jgi:hypothetical protein
MFMFVFDDFFVSPCEGFDVVVQRFNGYAA